MQKLISLVILGLIAALYSGQSAKCQSILPDAFFKVPGTGDTVSLRIDGPSLIDLDPGYHMGLTYSTASPELLSFIVSPMVYYAKGKGRDVNKYEIFCLPDPTGPPLFQTKSWNTSSPYTDGKQLPNYNLGLTTVENLGNYLATGSRKDYGNIGFTELPRSPVASDWFVVLNILRKLKIKSSPLPDTNQITYVGSETDNDSATAPEYSRNLAFGRGRIFLPSSSGARKGESAGMTVTDTVFLPLGNSFTMARQDTYHLRLKPRIYGAPSQTVIRFGSGDTQRTMDVTPLGTPICATAGRQQSISVASIPGGGAYVAWEDWRPGDSIGIYAQLLDKNGVPRWGANGIRVSPTGSRAVVPHIASGWPAGVPGGVYVVWQDFRSGNADIYIQALDTSGTKRWSAGGVKVCDAADVQDDAYPVTVKDTSVVVVWNDQRDSIIGVYAQRFNPAGTAEWTANGKKIVSAYPAYEPRAAWDEGNGVVVVWTEYNTDSSKYFVAGQRLAGDGTALWGGAVSVTGSVPGNQGVPQIVSNGGGSTIVTWQDTRSGAADIYAQNFMPGGARNWGALGNAVCTATNIQLRQVLAHDGAGGAIISWIDLRNGTDYDLYAQRMDGAGTAMWTGNGIAVATGYSNQTVPSIAAAPRGGAIISWQDGRMGLDRDIYAQYLDLGGTKQWSPANGLAVCTAADSQLNTATVIADPDTGSPKVVVCWEDKRTPANNMDIYSAVIQADGSLQGNIPGAFRRSYSLTDKAVPFYEGRPISLTAYNTTQTLWAITEIPSTFTPQIGESIIIYADIFADSPIIGRNRQTLYRTNDTVATNFWKFTRADERPVLTRDSVRQDQDSLRFFASALSASGIAFPWLQYERPDHSTASIRMTIDPNGPHDQGDLYSYTAALKWNSVVSYRYMFLDVFSQPISDTKFRKPSVPSFDSSYRAFTPEQIQSSLTLKNKAGTPEPLTNYRVRFTYNTLYPGNASGFELKFNNAAVCSVFTGRWDFPFIQASPIKKLTLSGLSDFALGDQIQIRGMCMKGSLNPPTLKWLPHGETVTLGNERDVNQPLLPMPNVINVLKETYNALGEGAIRIGIPQATPQHAPKHGWVKHKKFKDVYTSLKAPHTGEPGCFKFESGKPTISSTKSLENNKLFAHTVGLKFSIWASYAGITPPGFGDLAYFDHGHPLDGMTIWQISDHLDSVLTYCTDDMDLSYNGYDTVLQKILDDFSGKDSPIDTLSWGVGGLHVKGVTKLSQVSYLIVNPNTWSVKPTRGQFSQPEVFALQQNYPNPFNPATTIAFSLPTPSTTTLKVYNILGQVVATLLDREALDDGDHEVQFNAHNLASGVYFYRLVADEMVDPPEEGEQASPAGRSFVSVKKMLIIR